MKKALSILLALMLLLTLCACGNDDPSTEPETNPSTENTTAETKDTTECTHAYTEAVTKEATCAEEGVKTFTCSKCGDSYTEAIEKMDHSYTEAITKEATCAEEGVKTYTCAGCGDSYTESIAKVAHSWKNATCTAPKTCTSCGATEGSAAGHKWKNATCTAPKTCTTCGATEGEKLAHSYTDGVCSGCGKVDLETYVVGLWFCKDDDDDDGDNSHLVGRSLKFATDGSLDSWGHVELLKVIDFYYDEFNQYQANCGEYSIMVGYGPEDIKNLYLIDGEYYALFYDYYASFGDYVVEGNTVIEKYTEFIWATQEEVTGQVVYTLTEDGNLVSPGGFTYVKAN